MGGAKTEIDLAAMMMKRLRVIGSTLRARPLNEKAAVMSELETLVWPKLASGEIKPIIEKEYAIENVSDAHDLIASDTTIGKVILKVTHD